MQVLLATVGTIGDTLPFVWLGRELRRRGHDVTLLGNGAHRNLIEAAGLVFVEIISAAESERQARQRVRWNNARIALREGFANLLQDVEPIYHAIAERYVAGRTVVAAQGLAFGARIAQEKLGVPLATIHLQPSCFRSDRDEFVWPARMPLALIRLTNYLVDRVVDRQALPQLNGFRASLGLPQTSGVINRWWHSPQCTLGTFPAFLAPTRTEWSPEVSFTGFPIDDADCVAAEANEDEARLQDFLAKHPRPIVIRPTSAVNEASEFLQTALAASASVGRPAIVLTPQAEQLRDGLPANVGAFRFVPLPQLLPQASAIIHNGGIGTIAAALYAATPQLLVPRILDQPDNARRMARLGAAAVVPVRRFRAERVAQALRGLLDDAAVGTRCRELAEVCRRQNGTATMADAVERLSGTATA